MKINRDALNPKFPLLHKRYKVLNTNPFTGIVSPSQPPGHGGNTLTILLPPRCSLIRAVQDRCRGSTEGGRKGGGFLVVLNDRYQLPSVKPSPSNHYKQQLKWFLRHTLFKSLHLTSFISIPSSVLRFRDFQIARPTSISLSGYGSINKQSYSYSKSTW